MAKKSRPSALDFEADDTGGVLSGLLAEEDEFDRRALWRLGSWGVGATAAVVVAVMANQSSLGWKRDQMAAADLARQAQQIQPVARETQNEARRLAAAIDTLNSDRDRLYSRVTGLEQGLDSVTGAIARQGSARRRRRLPGRTAGRPDRRPRRPSRRSRPPRPRHPPPTNPPPRPRSPARRRSHPPPRMPRRPTRPRPRRARLEAAKAETTKEETAKDGSLAKAEAAKAEPSSRSPPSLRRPRR